MRQFWFCLCSSSVMSGSVSRLISQGFCISLSVPVWTPQLPIALIWRNWFPWVLLFFHPGQAAVSLLVPRDHCGIPSWGTVSFCIRETKKTGLGSYPTVYQLYQSIKFALSAGSLSLAYNTSSLLPSQENLSWPYFYQLLTSYSSTPLYCKTPQKNHLYLQVPISLLPFSHKTTLNMLFPPLPSKITPAEVPSDLHVAKSIQWSILYSHLSLSGAFGRVITPFSLIHFLHLAFRIS